MRKPFLFRFEIVSLYDMNFEIENRCRFTEIRGQNMFEIEIEIEVRHVPLTTLVIISSAHYTNIAYICPSYFSTT